MAAATPAPLSVNSANFVTDVIERSRNVLVLVDFWADWCAPCRALAPILDRIAVDYEGRVEIAKVNVDAEPDIARQLGIRSLPTVKLFHDANVVDEFMGAQSETMIRELLERHLQRLGRTTGSAGEDLSARRARLEAEVAANPEDNQRALALAEVLALDGDTAAAEALLDKLRVDAQTGDVAERIRALAHFGSARRDAPPVDALERRIAETPEDLDARHQLAARLIDDETYEPALEQLLEIMRRDRKFRDGLGRRALVAAFTIIGPGSALVARYRRRMSALLM